MTSPLKEPPLNVPGQSLDKKLHDILVSKVLLYAAILGFSLAFLSYKWMIYLFDIQINPIFDTFFYSILIALSAYKLYKIKSELLNLKQGRDGERVVGQLLEELRADGAVIFHDVETGKGNIDHIIISPKGIYTVETKTWSKYGNNAEISYDGNQLLVNGHKPDNDPISQCFAEADWLKNFLLESTEKSFNVIPLLVFPGWFISKTSFYKAQERGFQLYNPNYFQKQFADSPDIIGIEDLHLASYHTARYIKSKLNIQ